ncbi:MAG: DsbA family oxidoreductase [Pseudomonadota bacterium]
MSDSSERTRLLVDVITDPVCPWCYVGLHGFLRARDQLKDEFSVLPRLRAYQLNPDTPEEGVDRKSYYEKKFPDTEKREEMAHQLRAAAIGAGFQFDPAKPTRLPNTLLAHQLIRLSHYDGAQERVGLALFAAYWDDGRDIDDVDTLVAIAESAGMDGENARAILSNATNRNDVRQEAEAFRATGVSAVPTYVVNERHGFTGALPPGRMADALREAAKLTSGAH